MTDTIVTAISLDTSNKLKEQNFSSANPAAANSDLVNFAKAAVNLTTNTYVGTKRTDRVRLD